MQTDSIQRILNYEESSQSKRVQKSMESPIHARLEEKESENDELLKDLRELSNHAETIVAENNDLRKRLTDLATRKVTADAGIWNN
jgi:hypothetical protein